MSDCKSPGIFWFGWHVFKILQNETEIKFFYSTGLATHSDNERLILYIVKTDIFSAEQSLATAWSSFRSHPGPLELLPWPFLAVQQMKTWCPSCLLTLFKLLILIESPFTKNLFSLDACVPYRYSSRIPKASHSFCLAATPVPLLDKPYFSLAANIHLLGQGWKRQRYTLVGHILPNSVILTAYCRNNSGLIHADPDTFCKYGYILALWCYNISAEKGLNTQRHAF